MAPDSRNDNVGPFTTNHYSKDGLRIAAIHRVWLAPTVLTSLGGFGISQHRFVSSIKVPTNICKNMVGGWCDMERWIGFLLFGRYSHGKRCRWAESW